MNNNPQRLKEIYEQEREALQRWEASEYGRFVNNLTYRQRQVWIAKGSVPKSEVHMRRYRDWKRAESELSVVVNRCSFKIAG